jgi:hypothetical protein
MTSKLICILGVCITCELNGLAAQEELTQQFLSNAPGTYERCEARWFKNLLCTMKSESAAYAVSMPDRKTVQPPMILRFKAWKANVVVEMPSPFVESNPNGTVVLGQNDRYSFQIHRVPDGPWLVDEIQRPTYGEPGPVSPITDAGASLRSNLPLGVLGSTRSLSQLLRSADFVVEKSEVVAGDLLQVDFRINSPPEFTAETLMSSLRSGRLVVDPNKDWRLLEKTATVVHKNGGTSRTEFVFSYDTSEGAQQDLPVAMVAKVFYPGNAIVESRTTCSWSPANGQVESRDFTLSAYGLPEPKWARESPWKWLRLAFFSVLALIAAYGLYRVLRSRRSPRAIAATK